MNNVRPELPPMPPRIAKLPLSDRGYPVPWFVAWLDEDEKAVERGNGSPDFRVLHPRAATEAWNNKTCWVCGEAMGSYKSFVSGPMCAVNRTSAEPPSHRECAIWSAIACPFLTRPHARRREANLPKHEEAPGIMLRRNPGVAMVWTTKRPGLKPDPRGGMLFDLGKPDSVLWFAEGREATRDEVIESIESGLPALRALVVSPGDARALDRLTAKVMKLVPA